MEIYRWRATIRSGKVLDRKKKTTTSQSIPTDCGR